ncbi:MAG: hypothetical protein RIB58_05465 [Phycisphaerales bacterium]|jgi:hypothetical protein
MSSGKQPRGRIFATASGVVALALVVLGCFLLLSKARAELRADIYRDRLQDIAGQYAALADRYNSAVAQQAVTELVVEDGQMSVRVRSRRGVETVVPTSLDPSNEIYVDYVVIGGRLWIRRVFDDRTPPIEGVVIDPELVDIDWDEPDALVGKAVYRALGEGVWQVSVTGQGALGLVRVDESRRRPLIEAPELLEFETIDASVREEAERVSFGDLWRKAIGG